MGSSGRRRGTLCPAPDVRAPVPTDVAPDTLLAERLGSDPHRQRPWVPGEVTTGSGACSTNGINTGDRSVVAKVIILISFTLVTVVAHRVRNLS